MHETDEHLPTAEEPRPTTLAANSDSEDAEGEDESSQEEESDLEEQPETPDVVIHSLADVARLINTGSIKNIIVLAGAGISTSAGIPDFRSPETGLYANLEKFDLPEPEAIFELGFFKENPEPFWTLAKELYPGKHLPTPTHYFLKLLNDRSLLRRVYTQNIDTLETTTSLPPSKVIEAHGSFASSHCLACSAQATEPHILKGVREGKVVRCETGCGGLVKPDIVFFGEGLPDRFFESIPGDFEACDLLIVIGTSLKVHPFASLIHSVPSSTPRLLINRELVGEARGSWDRGFRFTGPGAGRDLFWQGEADEGCRELARELGWEEVLEREVVEGQRGLREKWGLRGEGAQEREGWEEAGGEKGQKGVKESKGEKVEEGGLKKVLDALGKVKL